MSIQLNWKVVNVAVVGNMALADYFLEPYKKVLQNWTRQLKKNCLWQSAKEKKYESLSKTASSWKKTVILALLVCYPELEKYKKALKIV